MAAEAPAGIKRIRMPSSHDGGVQEVAEGRFRSPVDSLYSRHAHPGIVTQSETFKIPFHYSYLKYGSDRIPHATCETVRPQSLDVGNFTRNIGEGWKRSCAVFVPDLEGGSPPPEPHLFHNPAHQ